jgi:Na+-driven multidrug efflux pump
MGVIGAAATSVLCQYVVLFVMLIAIKRFKSRPFDTYSFFAGVRFSNFISDLRHGTAGHIFKLTLPICLENTLFPLLTMVTARFEISFGTFAASISRVGTQVESLSWLVGAGFGAALTAFVGQNFGAGKQERIFLSFRYASLSLIIFGLFVTAVMWFGGDVIFNIFLPEYFDDAEMRSTFIAHIRILASCQIFANLEFAAANAFRGKGRTIPPSAVNIASNIIRVPMAYLLSLTSLGLLGIWAALSITTGLRGICIFVYYLWTERKSIYKA